MLFNVLFSSRFLKAVAVSLVMVLAMTGDGYAKTKQAAKAASAKSSAGDAAQPKADWQVGMIRGEKGEFNYCLMRAEYNNGLSLAIAMSPKQELNLGVGVPKAGFSKEEKHQMNVKIDGAFNKDAVAIAAQPELLIMPMSTDKKFASALKGGKKLILTGAEDKSVFALKNTSKAFQALNTCVGVGTGKIKMPEQAAQDAAPAAQQQAAAEPKAGKKLKPGQFPPSLKGLLVKAGLKDLQILEIKDPSKAPVDFGWKTAGLFGGMRERPVPAEATLDKMTDIIENGYKKQCTGMFNTEKGDIENYSGIKMRNVNVTCQLKERNAYVALFIYLTDNHLFTMFMHEGDGANKVAANKARDGIGGVIRALAKEQPANP